MASEKSLNLLGRKYFLFTLTILLFALKSRAFDGHRDFSPKSPEAAAFERVAEIPVGNYTGIPSITIPLYTIESGDLRLPISLDYQGTAIKVNQEATWVGLNWFLNAGGAITTQLSPTYDKSGLYPNEYKRAWNYLLNKARMQTFPPDGGEYEMKIIYKISGQHPDWVGRYGRNWFPATNGEYDTISYGGDLPPLLYTVILRQGDGECGQYHATFLGHTISFVWDHLKDEFFITGETQGFSITGIPGNYITITDGHGVQYEFRAMEQGRVDQSNVPPEYSRSDWTFYLTKILSPTGHTIRLVYKRYGDLQNTYQVRESLYSKNCPFQALQSWYGNVAPMTWLSVQDSLKHIRTLSERYILNIVHLDSIIADDMYVVFNANTQNRIDINGTDRSLNNIEIYKKTSETASKLLKRICFEYSYFPKNTIGGNTVEDFIPESYHAWYSNDDFMYYRLRLNKVWEEVDSVGSVLRKPPYIFGYHPANLPCKASAAVDLWGYYNNKENYNGSYHTRIPKHWVGEKAYGGTSMFPDGNYLLHFGADRRVDSLYCQAGMLTSIRYPTGGRVEFEYEPNSFTNYDYYCVQQEPEVPDIHFNTVTVYASNYSEYTQSGINLYRDEAEFEITDSCFYAISLRYCINDLQKKAYWAYFVGSHHRVELQKLNENSNAYESVSFWQVSPADTLNNQYSIEKTDTLELEVGSYKLKINPIGGPPYPLNLSHINASISLVPLPTPEKPIPESIGNGVRIKSITTQGDGLNTVVNYDYRNIDGETSGVLMAPVVYARKKLLLHQTDSFYNNMGTITPPPAPDVITYWIAGSDNLAATSSIPVAYKRVTVTKTGSDGAANGYSTFEYYNKRWNSGYWLDFMRRVEDPRNGKLLQKSDYNDEGTLVKQETNTYKMNCTESRLLSAVMENIYLGPTSPVQLTEFLWVNPYADALVSGCMQLYLYPSVQFSMNKTTSLLSDFVNGKAVVTGRETTFNQDNSQVKSIKETTSRQGENLLTEYIYPVDFDDSRADIMALKNRHIINVPIEKVQTISNHEGQYVIAAEQTEYTPEGLPREEFEQKTVPLPKNSFFFSNIQDNKNFYENVASITYNDANNPRTVTEFGHFKTTYVWGYNNKYPIAVIKGATAAQVQDALGGSNVWSNLENSLTPTMSSLSLHSQLSTIPQALATVYEFDSHIGMVKTIAPNGETKSFSYDAFSRLISITDHNGVVERAFNYHYKNE